MSRHTGKRFKSRTLARIVLDVKNYEALNATLSSQWALEDIKIEVVAQVLPDDNVFVVANVDGKWRVPRGALTPQSSTTVFCKDRKECKAYTLKQEAAGKGVIKANEQFFFPKGTKPVLCPTFTPSSPSSPLVTVLRAHSSPSACGDTVCSAYELDVGGTLQDLLLPGAKQKGTIHITELVEQLFDKPSNNNSFSNFQFSYYSRSGKLLWVNSSNASFGDVYIGEDGKPATVPSNPLLVPPYSEKENY